MDTNPHQLFLLADHIKLSLLERERATSHSAAAQKQDARLPRSLETLRSGLETLRQRQFDQEAAGDDTSDLTDQISRLQTQYDDQFSRYASIKSAMAAETAVSDSGRKSSPPKSVRFRDDPSTPKSTTNNQNNNNNASDPDDSNRAALFARDATYHDDPNAHGYTDEDNDHDHDHERRQTNIQIHESHRRTMRDQDEQIGLLASSVGRQRELSERMGHEFAEQNVMLDDVERGMDRHQGTLDRARHRLGDVSRRAKDNWSWLTIGILIFILVLLIVLIK